MAQRNGIMGLYAEELLNSRVQDSRNQTLVRGSKEKRILKSKDIKGL